MEIADRLADRVRIPTPSLFVQLAREAQALERQGRALTYLLLGEPDFPTPPHIVAAAKEAMDRGLTHYAPAEGLVELRRAIAGRVAREQGLDVDPDREVIVTTGATMGLYLALSATVNPGDEVILPEPFFGPYRAMVQYCGGSVRFVPLDDRSGHFVLDPAALRAALTPRTKAIILNSPSNPTGSVFTRDELLAIGQVAAEHDLFIVSDECYDAILYDGRHHVSIAALAPDLRERTIVVNSFSKTYAMTGWRIGYNVAAAPISQAMLSVYLRSGRCAAPFTQVAATAALEGPQDCLAEMQAAYTARRAQIVSGLRAIPGIVAPPPEGAFYVFFDAGGLGMDSLSLTRHILTAGGVVLLPGREFGPSTDRFVRLSFAASPEELERGVAGIAAALERLRAPV